MHKEEMLSMLEGFNVMSDSKYKGLKVALYARVSSLEQVLHGGSLAMQEDALNKWAKENGCTVYDTYIDDGHSATTEKRPALQRMIADSEHFDMVIFIKLDRFSRGVRSYYNIMDKLERTKTDWKAIFEEYDTTTVEGRFAINLYLTISQREADIAGERTRAVFKHKFDRGECTFANPPRGYKFSKEDGRRVLVVDEKSSRYVVAAFRHFLQFGSVRYTQTYLIDEYNERIDYELLRKLLSNKMYIGTYVHKQHGEFRDFCPPLISEKTFFDVQDLLEKNAKVYSDKKKQKHTYIFSGLLKCEKCGRRLAGGRKSKRNGENVYYTKYYRCPSHSNKRDCTNNYPLTEQKVEKFLLENVRAMLSDRIITYTVEEKETNLKGISAKIAAAKSKLKKVRDLFYADKISDEDYNADYDRFSAELEKLEEEHKKEVEKMEHFDIELYKAFLDQPFETIYKTFDEHDRRRLWLSVIDHIVASKAQLDPRFF